VEGKGGAKERCGWQGEKLDVGSLIDDVGHGLECEKEERFLLGAMVGWLLEHKG
jgi:hypothetical protein